MDFIWKCKLTYQCQRCGARFHRKEKLQEHIVAEENP